MLAALLVMVLAATFALVVVGAVHSLQVVEGADAAAWRAAALGARRSGRRGAVAALAAVGHEPDPAARRRRRGRESWQVTWGRRPPATTAVWPRVARAASSTAAGRARRRDDLMLELRTRAVGDGRDVLGRTRTSPRRSSSSGSGVYVGGLPAGPGERALRRRDRRRSPPTGLPADGVRGDVFPAAAVHGGAGIFARGVEIHDAPGSAEYPDDSDRHAARRSRAGRGSTAPSAEFLLAAEAAGRRRRALRSATDACGSTEVAAGGRSGRRRRAVPRCCRRRTRSSIEGSPSPAAGRLLVVVRGDAVLGQPGETVELSGGLVVCGRLEVRGDFALEGRCTRGASRSTRRLASRSRSDWRERPLPGAARADAGRATAAESCRMTRVRRRILCTQYSLCERVTFP